MRLLNRREFNRLCVALSPFIALSGASALASKAVEEEALRTGIAACRHESHRI
jgi:hypothetical protein